jgi:hypothetical protein
MMHSPNWLEEPKELNISFENERNYRRGFQKQPRDSNSYSLYAAKNIATNHNVQHDHVIHGNKGNSHSRKRKIYNGIIVAI